MNRTPIEWCRTYAADGSFEEGFSVNPVRFKPRGAARLVTMCQKVSPGCAHCYAETITRRFWPKDAAEKFPGYTAQGILAGDFVLDERTLDSVLRRKKPAKIFWGDMTDLFGEWVPDKFLNRCFAVCALTPHLTHMFLTKRPGRMCEYFGGLVREAMIGFQVSQLHLKRTGEPVSEWSGLPMPNVSLGTSVENQEQANTRIPFLLRTPSWIHYISGEPLLGEVILKPEWVKKSEMSINLHKDTYDKLGQETILEIAKAAQRGLMAMGSAKNVLDWVIVGGESGPGARPMHPDWARSLQTQCAAAGVPFFFKQWGEWTKYAADLHGPYENKRFMHFDGRVIGPHDSNPDGLDMRDWAQIARAGKKAAGALLDGKEYREFPEVTRG